MASRRSKAGRAKKQAEKMTRQANRRLQSMRARDFGKLSVVDLALADQRKQLKKNSSKFEVGKDANATVKRMRKFLDSKWTTEKGRAEILEKRIKSFTRKKARKGEELKRPALTKNKTLQLFDIFATDAYHKAKEKGLDSEQLIEFFRGKKRKDLVGAMEKALTAFVESDVRAEDAILFMENYFNEL